MGVIYRNAFVTFSAAQMFNLVNDVAQYPQFLPWCAKTQITHQTQTLMEASLCIKQGLLSKSFSTLNRLTPYERIEIRLREGPFKHLEGMWRFQTFSEGTQVSLELSFEFINPIVSLTLGPLFNQVAESLVQAFTKRAHLVYAANNILT